jgi:hypothetical protein
MRSHDGKGGAVERRPAESAGRPSARSPLNGGSGETRLRQLQESLNGGARVRQLRALDGAVNSHPAPEPAERGQGNGSGLPEGLKAGVEFLSGQAMDDVQVHYNSARPAQLNAQAFARGNHIHLGPGQERHLPHEAWHVVQQKQGRVVPTQRSGRGVPVNADPALEREADAMGARAASPGSPAGRTAMARPAAGGAKRSS